ncbi:hypothetical protein IKG33_03135 [Candidatus Saccharibacteria bacterium]|nr:hypothetical protein [Candidatus Saccharibacteria bacterium]
MAEKTKDKKNIIIGICVLAIVVVALVVTFILMSRRGGLGGLNDAFFTSDGTKYVLTLDGSKMVFDDEAYAPVKTHTVYYYSGDKITGKEVYYEYEDEEAAKTAATYYKNINDNEYYKEIKSDGKYVIMVANESLYENSTTTDVKEYIESIQSQNTTEEAPTEESENSDTEGIIIEDASDEDGDNEEDQITEE